MRVGGSSSQDSNWRFIAAIPMGVAAIFFSTKKNISSITLGLYYINYHIKIAFSKIRTCTIILTEMPVEVLAKRRAVVDSLTTTSQVLCYAHFYNQKLVLYHSKSDQDELFSYLKGGQVTQVNSANARAPPIPI